MPFMNVADAYAFKKLIPTNVQAQGRANRGTPGTFTYDYDIESLYATPMMGISGINGGFAPGQLNVIGSSRSSGKSNFMWMAHYLAQKKRVEEGYVEIKTPDIMDITDGDIPELVKMHDKTMNTIAKTIQLWELMLSVFGWQIEPDWLNARQFNRQQEYFQINGKRYSVRYNAGEIKISVQKDADAWKSNNIIELRHPQSQKVGGMYVLDRWRFQRDAVLGPDIVCYNAVDSNTSVPVLQASDMEAYMFQGSLVHTRMNTTVAECLASSCEDRIPYNFNTLDMNLEYLQASETNDDFSIILELIIAEQRARMIEYGERTSDLAHSIRVRSKFDSKEFNFE